ncbi:replication initiation protein [Clostridium baratii]|uniref:replication initiation protein n=1 Tax=Clostridium baratii TaxID=1561 RepID=UPI0005F2A13A|nr:replication initiation protein [Clostridium baratii]AQM58581.1 replication initiation protein [Clostridium baratii]KJU70930.1 hypothetical protein UC77_12220 [Clostridium baratii]
MNDIKNNIEKEKLCILNKSKDIILTNYTITGTENKMFNLILRRMKKYGKAVEQNLDDNTDIENENDLSLYYCEMTSEEFYPYISNKALRSDKGIESGLEALKGTSIIFWGLYEKKDEIKHNYNLIVGFDYIPINSRWKIYMASKVYRHLRKNKPYAPLNLEIVSRFKNFYSQQLYQYLRLWSRYGKSIEIYTELPQLRFVIGLEDGLYVDKKTKKFKFGEFNRRVLTPSVEEIVEKTKMKVEMEQVKKNRTVVGIKFIIVDNDVRKFFINKQIEPLKNIDISGLNDEVKKEIESQIDDLYYLGQVNSNVQFEENVNDVREFILEKLEEIKTSYDEDIDKVLDILKNLFPLIKDNQWDLEDIKDIWDISEHNIELISEVAEYSRTQNVGDLMRYLKKMVKPGVFKRPLKNNKKVQLRFNDFKQREYDYDELEKKLLGWDKDESNENIEKSLHDDIEDNTESNTESNSSDNSKESLEDITENKLDDKINTIKDILQEQLIPIFGAVKYNTWLKFGVENINLEDNKIIFYGVNKLTINKIKNEFEDVIKELLEGIDEKIELVVEIFKDK